MDGFIFELAIGVALVVIGWYFGTRNERKHLTYLDQAERLYGHIIVSNERFFEPMTYDDGMLVVGSVVIAQDRFKLFWASILSLFGKNLTVYESLLDRGRREAVVRMKQMAHTQGYNQIYGVRIETTTINDGGVEMLAYGTAIETAGNANVPPKLPS